MMDPSPAVFSHGNDLCKIIGGGSIQGVEKMNADGRIRATKEDTSMQNSNFKLALITAAFFAIPGAPEALAQNGGNNVKGGTTWL
ncbi:MAG: hypothetical protein ACXWBP_12165 [Limisphaerales bacterium]